MDIRKKTNRKVKIFGNDSQKIHCFFQKKSQKKKRLAAFWGCLKNVRLIFWRQLREIIILLKKIFVWKSKNIRENKKTVFFDIRKKENKRTKKINFRRIIRLSNFLNLLTSKKVATVFLIILVISSSFFLYSPASQGATYTYVQTDWSGGVSASTSVHPTNQTGWTYYSAADSEISAGTEVTLSPTSSTETETSDTDFSDGTFTNTEVTGSGDSASLMSAIQYPDFYLGEENTYAGSTSIRISGNYAFIVKTNSQVLYSVDISDPTAPVLADQIATGNYVKDVFIDGNYAYVTNASSGLYIYDISDPTNLSLTGSYNTAGGCYGVYVSGSYAYVADYGSGLIIVNVSNPASPTLVGTYDTAGYAFEVIVSGNYAYIADYTNGLEIVDVSNPASPTQAANFPTTGRAYDVVLNGTTAYIADGTNGVVSVNITDPTNPSLLDEYTYIALSVQNSIYFDNDMIYAASSSLTSSRGLTILDVSDPSNMTLVNRVPTAYLSGVTVDSQKAYVLGGNFGLMIFDVSDVGSYPYFVGSYSSADTNEVYVSGSYAYVYNGAVGLDILDISDPSAPSLVGQETSVHAYGGVDISGNYLFGTGSNYGLEITDITDPANPSLIGTYDTAGTASEVKVSGNYAYVADGSNGLVVVNVSDVNNPSLAGSYATTGNAYDVTVSGNYAYVADTTDGLIVLNISDPTNPILSDSSAGDFRGVVVSGNYAFVGDYGNGKLKAFDVSNPANISQVGETTIGRSGVEKLEISGDYVFVASGIIGVKAINISDPTTPGPAISFSDDSNDTINCFVDDSHVYIADDAGGLKIYARTYYVASGTYESSTLDLGQKSDFSTLVFSKTNYTGTLAKVQLAANNDGSTWNYVGPDGTDATYFSTTGTAIDSSLDGSRYVRYKAYFENTDQKYSTLLNSVSINYSYYSLGSSYALTSSWYDSSDPANAMSQISWSETLPSNTDVQFQIQTAPDSSGSPGTATGFVGPDGTSGTYFTDSTGGESVPAALNDGSNDQWFQYKAFLTTTDGSVTPTLSDVSVQYVVNAPPQLQNVTASQDSDGHVNISYDVLDPDTTDGTFTPGYITPSFEYWNGSSWVAITTLASGDTDNKAVEEGSYTTYTATWTPKTDFDEQFMNGTAKIRVTVDDNEANNNTASTESSTFTLDTKDPTNLSFTIDHTTDALTITTPSDDSSYVMYVSNSSSFTGAEAESFASPYTYASMTDDPATVYIRIQDAYGNYTDASTTTPAKPEGLTYYDVTDTEKGDYRELIAWSAVSAAESGSGFSAYQVYRSTDQVNYTLVGTREDRLINYYIDSDVESAGLYYYKLYTEDTDGNKSAFSDVVSDTVDGQGSSDSTPPTISSVTVSGIQTTSATVTWTTEEVSDSSVGYSTDSSYLPELGVASMSTSHEVVLTGLTPGTTYNIRTKSRDASGNLAQNDKDDPGTNAIEDFTFETLPGPAISAVTVPSIANNQATITWQTTTDSSTYVVYAASTSGGSLVDPVEIGTPELVGGSAPFTHTQEITGLTENTTYYFYVKSIDGSDNTAIDNNGGEFYELLTTQDSDAPVISSVETSIVSDAEVAIHWVTDEQATSQVKYATESGGPYTTTTQSSVLSRSHYVIITGLTSDTTYYYQVVSEDINTNSATSDEYNFTTDKDAEYQHDPLSEITGVEESVVTDQKAVISFDTDQPAMCSIEYGTQTGNYTEVPISESEYDNEHDIHLTGLIFSTTYYYTITCEDNLETVVEYGDEESFSTLDEIGAGDDDDTTAPSISGVDVGDITGESVTVTWKTDEVANGFVKYGIVDDDEEFYNVAGNAVVNSSVDEYVNSHEVIINNLVPDTKYYYAVLSIDAAGNIGESSQDNFTTESASSLSSIKIESQSLNAVTITWESSVDTTSVVEYGLTEEYGDRKESSSETKEHSVELTGLKSNTTYHFRVKGKDSDNNWYSSGDYTLEPKSPPNISDVNISEITEREAQVTFRTNVPTDALVTYSADNEEYSGSQGKLELAIEHTVTLTNLQPGTNFSITIKARDEEGNESEDEAGNFTTGKDEKAPEIDHVKTDSALAQNDKVQTIISWVTDEPSKTILIYKEGLNSEEKEITISDSFTQSHIAVVTAFKPGNVYYFRVKAVDEYGNESYSQDYALLTPRRKENIVQIIITNFQDIFGWAKM